jgi:hypothetical protein
MALGLQVVSSRLLGVHDITGALASQSAVVDRTLPYAASEAVKCPHLPRLFLHDGSSLAGPPGPLSGRWRRDSPASKFLAPRFHVCKVLNKRGLESRRSLGEPLGLETV